MNNWIEVGPLDNIDDEDVARFDHNGHSYAICRVNDQVYALDGHCTHERVHLCDGLVMGHVIECPKHNGRFDVRDGRAMGAPVCVNLKTHPARVDNGVIYIQPES